MEKPNDYIIIGFSTTTSQWNPIPALIRAIEGTKYSHTYARFASKSLNRSLVYHASRSFLHFMSFERLKENHPIVKEYLVPVTPEQKTRCLQYCIDKAGTDYGRTQLLGMGLARVGNSIISKLKLPMPYLQNPFADGEKTEVCSEVMGRLLIIIGETIDVSDLEYDGPKYIDEHLQSMVSQGKALSIEPGTEYISGELD